MLAFCAMPKPAPTTTDATRTATALCRASRPTMPAAASRTPGTRSRCAPAADRAEDAEAVAAPLGRDQRRPERAGHDEDDREPGAAQDADHHEPGQAGGRKGQCGCAEEDQADGEDAAVAEPGDQPRS